MNIFKRVFGYFYNAPSKYVDPAIMYSPEQCAEIEIRADYVVPVQRTLTISQHTHNSIRLIWSGNEAILNTNIITAQQLRDAIRTGYSVPYDTDSRRVEYLNGEMSTVDGLIRVLQHDGYIVRDMGSSRIKLSDNVTLN